MNRPKVWSWLVCASLLVFSVVPILAQDDDSRNDDQRNDPPGRVARMNLAQGSVSFQPGGEGDWVDAVPNRPMTTGDNLWTDRNSRAELHVGSTAIRLSSETSLTFLDLDDHATQLRLAQGSVVLNVRHLDDNDTVEVDTPNLSFQVQYSGEYRVDVDPDGRTTVVDVFHGRGEALGGGHNYTIVANQHATFRGGASGDQSDGPLDYEIDRLPYNDEFDSWCLDRDRREDRSESASYVSREMTGYEDLDDYGRWDYDATYGHVWVPTRVDAGWAPYREGHWAFVAPWGWTWVDDAPWGFAPFHYGRWCRVRESWAWIPGPVVVRPVYAPALVAFVGGGGFHLSVGFGGGGGVAWFPLGPGEVFVPAYHVSRTYVNQVNVTNTVVNVTKVTNVYNTTVINNNTTVVNNVNKIVYVNQRAPNGVTAVSHDTFVNARPVARNVVQVSQRDIEQAPVTHMTGVDPVKASVMGSGRVARFAPPAAVATRQVVAQRPPAPPTVPFAQRQDPLVARGPRPVPPTAGGQPMQPQHLPPNQLPPNPGRPDPVVPRPNQPPTNQPGMTANQPVPHPMPPNPVRGQGEISQPAQPERPAISRPDVPRPGSPAPVATRPETPRTPAPNEEAGPQQGWSHPLARPVAPPQPKSPQQGQDEERKFNQWQQKQASAPAQRPPARKQEQREEKPRDPKHK